MPPDHRHPSRHIAGRHRRGPGRLRGNLLVIEAHARQVLDRLVAVAGLGLLATLASARAAAHGQAIEQAHDDAATNYHRLQLLARQAQYDILHVGGDGIGVATMIITELIGTVVLIALLIFWAERRRARSGKRQ